MSDPCPLCGGDWAQPGSVHMRMRTTKDPMPDWQRAIANIEMYCERNAQLYISAPSRQGRVEPAPVEPSR